VAKKTSVIQWMAWFYCVNFLAIVTISHWPGLTDAQGRLMGLYVIDPVDDIFHLVSGLLAAIVAWKSRDWSLTYFKYAGLPYGIDAITGIFFSTEFLNGDAFVHGFGKADFSVHNLLNNAPHVVIPVSMLWIAYWLSKRVQ
jgi:hypothetical protein